MNKKLIILFIILGLVVIGGVIGFICYRNTPDYVMKEYVKAYNNDDYEKMISLEYNFDNYTISNKNYDVKNNGYEFSEYNLVNKESDKQKINDNVNQYWYEVDTSNISKICIYEITDNNFPCPSVFKKNIIIVGKINGQWRIVLSPFYLLTK